MTIIAGATYREGVAYAPDGSMYVTATGNASLTGGTITGTNVPYVLAQWSIPFIHISSGSIGNNGALSGVTALDTTYSGGAWCYYPANSIAAGVAAGWYWTVFSSTTAGTIYNSTYTSGVPGMGVQTAFATTGPGAFTGDTTERIGPIITIPANALGPNGSIRAGHLTTSNTAAGAKTARIYNLGGGAPIVTQDLTTTGNAAAEVWIENRGATNKQFNMAVSAMTIANSATVFSHTTVDTTSSTTLQWTLQKATATNNQILQSGFLFVTYGA